MLRALCFAEQNGRGVETPPDVAAYTLTNIKRPGEEGLGEKSGPAWATGRLLQNTQTALHTDPEASFLLPEI